MEKFQGPTSNHHCFGGNLDQGVLQQCHGNTSFNFSYGAPYFNLEEESFTIQEEQQQQEEPNTNQQSSLSLSVPITSLEDKMPFLEMLKSVDSPYYSDPSPAPLNPHFKMLLTLQQQHQHQQIPHFSGSSSSDQSSMDYYYSHQLEASQPVAFQPQSCVTATKVENQAHSSIKSEDNKENGEQEHMEQLEQDYYLSLHLESANNENNKTDNGELGGEPPNHSSPESLNCRQTVSSPTTTCCLAETESCISPHDMPPSKTKSASKQALPAARLVTSSTTATTSGGGGGHEREKKKRKRTRPNKNREEVESQRMTHIAVERNRRRQMNDHLNALRSLMPSSFVQRGDQASIIGGAIDFVKELEQLLHSLEAKKRTRTSSEDEDDNEKVGVEGYKGRRRNRTCGNHSSLAPFLGFFSAPQYTSYSSSLFLKNDAAEEDEKEEEEVINEDQLRIMSSNNIKRSSNEHEYYSLSLLSPSSWLGVDIEVVVVQTHVNLKILGPRKSGQLVRVIAALEQDLRLTILHLNVTSFEQSVLYSFNLKIEDDCKLGGSADEIATAVYQIFSSTNNQLHLIS